MNKKRQYPAIVIFAALTAVTSFIWIGFEVYSTITSKPEPTVPESATAELLPILDTETLSKVSTRLYLEDSEIGETQLSGPTEATSSPVSSETPLPTQTPEATSSAQPSPTPTEVPNASPI